MSKRDCSGPTYSECAERKQIIARLFADLRGERYDVSFDGELIVRRSRVPELDLARALLARGITGTITVLDGNSGKRRSIVNIEAAARLTVEENRRSAPRFVKWRPHARNRPPEVGGSLARG